MKKSKKSNRCQAIHHSGMRCRLEMSHVGEHEGWIIKRWAAGDRDVDRVQETKDDLVAAEYAILSIRDALSALERRIVDIDNASLPKRMSDASVAIQMLSERIGQVDHSIESRAILALSSARSPAASLERRIDQLDSFVAPLGTRVSQLESARTNETSNEEGLKARVSTLEHRIQEHIDDRDRHAIQ